MHIEFSTIAIALPFISSLVLVVKLHQWQKDDRKLNLEPEEQPIPYPEPGEKMFDRYNAIKSDLQLICHPCQLRDLNTRITLFNVFYNDSPTFYKELVDLYNSVEAEFINPI